MQAIEPHLGDFFLIGLLALAMPLIALHSLRKVRALSPEVRNSMRPRFYSNAMVMEWVFGFVAVAPVLLGDSDWAAIGVVVPNLEGTLYGALLVGGLGIVIAFSLRRLLKNEEGAAQVREATEAVEWLIPRGPKQRRLWWVVSLHAGVGEELFYRGYLFAVLLSFLPPIWAAVAGSLIFGFAHLYQGVRGVVQTAILGGVFLGLYHVSGGLWVPMAAHVLYDIYAGELGSWAYAQNAGRDDHP